MAYDFYIRKKQDLIEAVQEYGIVPYFQTSIPGFSLQERKRTISTRLAKSSQI